MSSEKLREGNENLTNHGNVIRDIVATLTPTEDRRHSNSLAEIVITDADPKISVIGIKVKEINQNSNFISFKSRGWDGIHCIDCHDKIPAKRRQAVPNCYRCRDCQAKKEDMESGR